MKALIVSSLLVLLSFTQVSFANQTLEATADDTVKILDLVVGVNQAYSRSSELQAKVVEILVGDGMNPTRMILVLSTGLEESKIFELDAMMYSVKRITFLNTDVIVINYVQDDFDNMDEMNPVQKNRSITLQVLRNEDGTLSNQIKILK